MKYFFDILHKRENNTYFSSDASEVCKILTILKNKMNSFESYQFANDIMLIK